jgi:hypothetical protein
VNENRREGLAEPVSENQLREEINAGLAALIERDDQAHHDQPDKENTRKLLGPEKWALKGITPENLPENSEYQNREKDASANPYRIEKTLQ